MTNSLRVLRVGTRNSKLALIQADQAADYFDSLVPSCSFEIVAHSSPGDRDLDTDLRISPDDFFTKDLDDAVLNRSIDAGVHSAKDLPPVIRNGLDWCWLPMREDPRDVIVLPEGKSFDNLPANPRIGISSVRREAWCKERFPQAELLPIRGTIEHRIEQLDSGRYDIIIMAAAALIRLNLQNRISQYIDKSEMNIPDGQGILALTFRIGDPIFTTLRKFFIKQVTIAGAGCGRASTCTLETAHALSRTEVCIHDALMDKELLRMLPADAVVIDAGKRLGDHTVEQPQINEIIADYARRGFRVTRLKGGDPGIFGRLAEETDTLDALSIPYTVLPGISSLQCSTSGTGMNLTRRGMSRGFCVMTPRCVGGAIGMIDKVSRGNLPQVYFMGLSSIKAISSQLIADGTAGDSLAAIVIGAGTISEKIIKGTIFSLPDQLDNIDTDLPGIIIIGDITQFSYFPHGALGGKRVLVTCSDALQQQTCDQIRDYGGVPVPYPAIKLTPVDRNISETLKNDSFDWLILTSPSAVHSLMTIITADDMDIRILPQIAVCGDGTANALKKYNLKASIVPQHNFGADGLIDIAASVFRPGQKILRLRSDAAGESLTAKLTQMNLAVTDIIICKNEHVNSGAVPQFDCIFFASASSVKSLLERQDNPVSVNNKVVLAIGRPTLASLEAKGIKGSICGKEATVESAIETLSLYFLRTSIEKILKEDRC